MKKIMIMTVVALLTVASPASAGKARRVRCRGGTRPTTAMTTRPVYYQPTFRPGVAPTYAAAEPRYYAPASPAPAPAPSYVGGLLAAVNNARARYGLRPFAHDASLAAAAETNNRIQAQRGLGHHHMVGAAQIAAGTQDPNRAVILWLNSPAHRRWLLGNGSVAGVAYSHGYATLNAR